MDEIDQTCVIVRDTAQYHGLLEGHMNLILGQRNLMNSQKTSAIQAQSLARLEKLEDMMAQVHATFMRFSKQHDVHQTANLLRQRVDEIVQDPHKLSGPIETMTEGHGDPGFEGQGIPHIAAQVSLKLYNYPHRYGASSIPSRAGRSHCSAG